MSEDIKTIVEKVEAKEAIANNTATKQQEEKVDYAVCPCCGKPTLIKPIQVKGPLLDHYIACIVSGVPFSHTYPIYEDKIRITITQLDRSMAVKIAGTEAVLNRAMERIPTERRHIEELLSMLKLYCSISQIDMTVNVGGKRVTPATTVLSICDKIIALGEGLGADVITESYQMITSPAYVSGLPTVMLGSIVSTHNELYNILMGVGFGQNFWKGIELG